MKVVVDSIKFFVDQIYFLDSNTLNIVIVLLGGSFTLLAAGFGINSAFKQIQKQFEHKMIYEGWSDFQKKLFDFSSLLSKYTSDVMSLTYFLNTQNNFIVNKGNKEKHRVDQWNRIEDSFLRMNDAYVDFLSSYENHEVIFLRLGKMKTFFYETMENRLEKGHISFMESLFPEMYGSSLNESVDRQKELINTEWQSAMEISCYLDDFRIELQNETIGAVLNKKVPHRHPLNEGIKVLTRKGFINS